MSFDKGGDVDSFEAYADDFFRGLDARFLDCVRQEDLKQLKVDFAVYVSHLSCADNFRVARLHDERSFYAQAARGCCGEWNSQVVCRSGNVYWVGCNYGH